MKIKAKKLLPVLFFIMGVNGAGAQYYDWGQDLSSIKWIQTKTPHNSYIYPESYSRQASCIMQYMDTIRPYIGYGFSRGPMNVPVIFHAQNFQQNGIVMLAPKRMELIVTPGSSTFAMPWLKQLAVHETRHAVHYNNINRGFIKFLGYALGQQGTLVGLAFLPQWMIEGDAVMAETQMTTFGRGLQPSFTIEYRAMALEGRKRFAPDKYFSGSYKDYMPDHYQLGYQMVSYTFDKYGENIWDKVARYSANYPFLIVSNRIALKKYYGTTVNKIFRETMDDLYAYWNSLPLSDNSARLIESPVTSYTSYITPVTADGRTAYAIKSDLDKTHRLVSVDIDTGTERVLANLGIVNSGLSYGGGMLYWTEYRQSTFWEQRVNSQLCVYDLSTGKYSEIPGKTHVQFAAAMPDGTAATVEYNYEGCFDIRYRDWTLPVPDSISVHGLDYDRANSAFYFIGLGDSGMWIGRTAYGEEKFDIVKSPTYSSLSSLRAENGKLYFTSISSGKDEAHMYDTGTGKEYLLTESRYGSFSPFPASGGDEIILTTYTPQGYMLAHQRAREIAKEIPLDKIPANKVNPARSGWDVINIDTVNVSGDLLTANSETKRYRKGTHLFQFHSWAPVYFDAEQLIDENETTVKAGVTLLSQNKLNNTVTQLGYYWDGDHSNVKAKMNFYALAPKFEIEAHWSDRNQLLFAHASDNIMVPDNLKNYFEVSGRVYLPILLASGYHIRRLTPSATFSYANSLLYNSQERDFRKHKMQKSVFSIQFVDNVWMAHRDFLPRWGYALRASATMNPFSSYLGKIFSGYARVYTPGVAKHHSFTLRGAFQYQKTAMYAFRQKELFPRGADFNFTAKRYQAVSADYQLPLCYPDWGINSILFFKRIRLNLNGDYARYQTFGSRDYHNLTSYGADIILDISPVRLPASTTPTVTFSINRPSDKKKVIAGFSLNIPI